MYNTQEQALLRAWMDDLDTRGTGLEVKVLIGPGPKFIDPTPRNDTSLHNHSEAEKLAQGHERNSALNLLESTTLGARTTSHQENSRHLEDMCTLATQALEANIAVLDCLTTYYSSLEKHTFWSCNNHSLDYVSTQTILGGVEERNKRHDVYMHQPGPVAVGWPSWHRIEGAGPCPDPTNINDSAASLLRSVPLLGTARYWARGTISKLLLATLAISPPVLAAPAGVDYNQKLVDDLKKFATTAAELLPGVIFTGGYQYAVWRLIESGAQQPAADETEAQASAQHRAYYQGAQSLGCVVLFVAADGWGWADDHAIEFKGLAFNCVAALCIYHYYQSLAHRTWFSKAHGLVQLLMLAFFGAILYSLGHGSWIALVWWSITCLYPLGARLNINTLLS